MREITVQELKAWMASNEDFNIIDVREPDEYRECAIEGSKLIPLGELPSRLSELDKTQTYVMQCRSGGRSARAVEILEKNGFKNAINLAGGILDWIKLNQG